MSDTLSRRGFFKRGAMLSIGAAATATSINADEAKSFEELKIEDVVGEKELLKQRLCDMIDTIFELDDIDEEAYLKSSLNAQEQFFIKSEDEVYLAAKRLHYTKFPQSEAYQRHQGNFFQTNDFKYDINAIYKD